VRIRQGEGYRIPVTVQQRNLDGTYTLVDPGGIAGTLQLPDLTTTSFTPTRDATGQYHADISPATFSQLGHYQWKVVTTGTGAGVSVGSLDVADPFEMAIMSLADAKDALNIAQATTTYDTEIQSKIDTVLSALERLTGGPLVNRTIVERAEVVNSGRAVILRQRPVVSVTSIADIAGIALSVADVDVDPNSGIIRRRLGWVWSTAYRWVTVTYVAGWGVPTPAAFGEAARIIVAHLWETQRGPSTRPNLAGDEVTSPGLGFAIPNRAAELLAPYVLETAVG
jgi:hypothetical protein